MGKLTAKAVATKGPGRHADGEGLYLLVKPSGARSWLLRVQADGRRRDLGLGSVDVRAKAEFTAADDIPVEERRVLSLSDAREKAAIFRKMAKVGLDPAGEIRRKRGTPRTFKQTAVALHAAKKEGWSQATADDFLASLSTHAYPVLGDMLVGRVETKDVQRALAPIWHSKPAIAAKVRNRIMQVLDFASANDWREKDAPRAGLKTVLSEQEAGGHMKAMPHAEVPAFMASLRDKPETVARLALQFLVLTGARSGEVRRTTWAHIDAENGLWNRPAELMKGTKKKRKPHTVTLSAEALAVLKRAAEYRVNDKPDALVFPSKTGGALSDMTLSKILRDAKLPYVPHGFRASFRTWAQDAMPQIPDHAAEAAIAHAIPDKIVKIYGRSDFIAFRRQLTDEWGRYVNGTGNIVHIGAARG